MVKIWSFTLLHFNIISHSLTEISYKGGSAKDVAGIIRKLGTKFPQLVEVTNMTNRGEFRYTPHAVDELSLNNLTYIWDSCIPFFKVSYHKRPTSKAEWVYVVRFLLFSSYMFKLWNTLSLKLKRYI
jgi:hypothetical protein